MAKKSKKAGKARAKTALWAVGYWATVWWGVSGLYLVLLVWLAKNYYASNPDNFTAFSLTAWKSAISVAYSSSSWLPGLLGFILGVWLIIGYHWLKALKQARISYKAGLKDLLFTIRK